MPLSEVGLSSYGFQAHLLAHEKSGLHVNRAVNTKQAWAMGQLVFSEPGELVAYFRGYHRLVPTVLRLRISQFLPPNKD